MHTLRLAHTLLYTQYAHARHCRVQTCYISLGFGPYRGVSCHRVEEAAALFDVCPAGLTLMITDVKSVYLCLFGPWIGGIRDSSYQVTQRPTSVTGARDTRCARRNSSRL